MRRADAGPVCISFTYVYECLQRSLRCLPPHRSRRASQAKPLQHAWTRVVGEAVGPEGQVWPGRSAAMVRSDACPWTIAGARSSAYTYGATRLGEAQCCDLVTREGHPQPSEPTRDGAALAVAKRCKRAAYLELLRRGPQRLYVLACETGSHWNDESLRFVAQLVRLRALRALRPASGGRHQGLVPAMVGAVKRGYAQHACCHFARVSAHPDAQAPPLQDVLPDTCPPVPSCLPSR